VARSHEIAYDAPGVGIPEARNDGRSIRPAGALVARLTELDPTPLTESRPPQHRVVGTGRDFTVLSCAFLRHRGTPARARCGFAIYFEQNKFVDHGVVEYWTPSPARWVRIDSEILGLPFVSAAGDPAAASNYRISVYYDRGKVAVNRLAFSQGHELEPFDATAVAVTPGFLRSEMMLEAFGVSEERWRDSRPEIWRYFAESSGPGSDAELNDYR
jgi:hypothetical protein